LYAYLQRHQNINYLARLGSGIQSRMKLQSMAFDSMVAGLSPELERDNIYI
jgi:hypothetical protein